MQKQSPLILEQQKKHDANKHENSHDENNEKDGNTFVTGHK